MTKGLFVLSLSLGAAFASAQSFNIDFELTTLPGDLPSLTYGAAGQAGVWNSISNSTNSAFLTNLSGDATSVQYTENYWNGGGVFIGSEFGWVRDEHMPLFEDYWQLGAGFSFTGLSAGIYEVIIYAAYPHRTDTGNYTVNGVTKNITSGPGTTGFLEGRTHATFSNLTVTDRIDIDIERGFTGMQIRQVSAEAVPEPFTMTLLGAGALVAYRRKRKAKQA